MRRPLLAVLLAAATLPTNADSFTYQGTIGKSAIVVELSTSFESADADSFGRYFYPRVGIDIPLRAIESAGGTLMLAEELSCAENPCETNDEGVVVNPPLGALWTLATTDGGATLTGTWAHGGRSMPVTLTFIDQFPYETHANPQPEDLALKSSIALWAASDDGSEPPPYERLKMQAAPLDEGPTTDFDGSTYRYVVDPRTRFAFPRIVALADGGSVEAANRTLERRHWAMNADALGCAAREFAGMGWSPWTGGGGGSLGGWDEETLTVTYLSPTVMSWTESGSIFCGGAHPYNHSISRTIDVGTGELLNMGRIFRGWVARTWDREPVDFETALTMPDEVRWGPYDELVAYVTAHRHRSGDTEFEEECGIDDLIPEYLTIGFASRDSVVFGLGGLPHAINACGDDLLAVPLADIRQLLTPAAARWFPSLAQ